MIAYVLRRVAQSAFAFLLATFLIFALYNLIPAHGSTVIPGEFDTPAQVASFEAQPFLLQYVRLLGQWVSGNFGYFPTFNVPIINLVGDAVPVTAVLVGCSLLLTFATAIPIGLVQGLNYGRTVDRLLTGVTLLFFSAPLILVAPLLSLWFTYDARLLPPGAPPSGDFASIFSNFGTMILPIVTLALPGIGRFAQIVRSAVIDQGYADYILTARAKGAGGARIVWFHVLRNVSIPVVNSLGVAVPLFLSGALVVEAAFNLPGLGYLLWQAANPKHLYFPVEISIIVVTAAFVIVANFVVDLVILAIDPRIAR